MPFTTQTSGVTLTLPGEVLRIEAWGTSTIRVRSSVSGDVVPVTEGLSVTEPTEAIVTVNGNIARVTSGALTAIIESHGRVRFEGLDGALAGEVEYDPNEPPLRPHRLYLDDHDGGVSVEATFQAWDDERIYGLGQHSLARLDLKGCVIDLLQRNSHISIPAIMSSRGYGMFWNSASVGRVEFAANHTRWVAQRASGIDYFVYAGQTPAEVLRRYHELTGFPRRLPEWATGYWQSNSYYVSQDELLAVAREHLSRGLPLSAIFVDFMHWTHLGEWEWDRGNWPDPASMVAELAEAGVQVMVAVWPQVSPHSKHFTELRDRGLLVDGPDGSHAVFSFADRAEPAGVDLALLDLTHADARRFYWERVRENYYDIGVRAFWLDACEPELSEPAGTLREAGARFARGHGTEFAGMFPLFDAQAIRDGLDEIGDIDSMILERSAWAGSQRYGVTVWSGDIQSTWESLRTQVGAGLNMMASGMPWWTTDIGGFFDADVESEDYRELLVRWFQFATFWPVVRLHGNRHADFFNSGIFSSGGPNEVWSFGDKAYEVMSGLLFFRERLRPYVQQVMDHTTTSGLPPVRPLWFQNPHDPVAVQVDDQFLLGDDLLIAPVLQRGASSRKVYLPADARWRDAWTGAVHAGGGWITVEAPLHIVPLLIRDGSDLTIESSWFER